MNHRLSHRPLFKREDLLTLDFILWQVLFYLLAIFANNDHFKESVIMFGWLISQAAFWTGVTFILRRPPQHQTLVDWFFLRLVYPLILASSILVLGVADLYYSPIVHYGFPIPRVITFGWFISQAAFWTGALIALRRYPQNPSKLDRFLLQCKYPLIFGSFLLVLCLGLSLIRYSHLLTH